MILVQMYNIFRLLIGVPDYSRVVSRMEENKNMSKMMGIFFFFFFSENVVWRRIKTHLDCSKKNQNAARPSERPPVREEKMSNDISTDAQYI